MIKEELATIGEQIKALEAQRRELYRQSVEAPEDEKACPDYVAQCLGREGGRGVLEYPIEVTGIHQEEKKALEKPWRCETGAFVAIRPCDPECHGKTYLGVYIGDLAMGVSCSVHRVSGVMTVGFGWHNPAIYVPELKRVVLGAESWWGQIKKPEDLKQISDADIQGVWYVQALKALEGKLEAKEGAEDDD